MAPSIIAATKTPPITPATPAVAPVSPPKVPIKLPISPAVPEVAPVNPPKVPIKASTLSLELPAAPPIEVNGVTVSFAETLTSPNESDKLFICLLALEDAWPASSRAFPNSDNGRLESLAALEISDILLSIAPPSSLNSNVPQMLNTSAIPSPP